MSTFSIVTVVYEKEISMLGVQARSISKFVKDINEIIIINNASDEKYFNIVDHRIKSEILPLYGELASKVRLYDVKQLTGKYFYNLGWESQQILKLLSGDISDGLLMILDSKNYFISDCNFSAITQDNKPKMLSKELDEELEDYFYNSCELLNLSPEQVKQTHAHNKGISTPFLVYANTIRDCKKYLELILKEPIVNSFPIEPVFAFEFYLIGAYISINYGLDNYYFNEDVPSVWRKHRMDYKNMSQIELDNLAYEWHADDLFELDTAKEQIRKILKDIKT